MTSKRILHIKIAVVIEDYQIPDFFRPKGPLYHRWLPDGRKDAFSLPIDDPGMELQVWFERRGYVSDYCIEYDRDREEVDTSIMSRQAKLDAGPLFGELQVKNVPNAELTAIEKKFTGHKHYITIVKRIVRSLYPPLSAFLKIIRTNFGQYWIRDLSSWDSHKMSLSTYCQTELQLSWSLDDGETWDKFVPDEYGSTGEVFTASDELFSEYLIRSDHEILLRSMHQGYVPGLEENILASAYRLFDYGEIRHAIIEATIAAELAVHHFNRNKVAKTKLISDNVQSFYKLPLARKLALVASYSPQVSTKALEEAIKAIDVRNRVVHEGWQPPNDIHHRQLVKSLIKVVSQVIDAPAFKFPCLNSGNRLYKEEIGE